VVIVAVEEEGEGGLAIPPRPPAFLIEGIKGVRDLQKGGKEGGREGGRA